MNYRQCTATSKRTGKRCRARAMNGRNVCYFHGGMTPRGVASPHFKTGRYSKYLPDKLAEKYQLAQGDPELLGLRDDIALIDARTAELLKQAQTGESGRVWEAVRKTYQDLNMAIKLSNAEDMAGCLQRLDKLIMVGVRDYAIWREITDNLEQRRRLVESERRRLMDMEQMITVERVMLLVAAIVDIVRKNVTDVATLQTISADVGKLVSANHSEST